VAEVNGPPERTESPGKRICGAGVDASLQYMSLDMVFSKSASMWILLAVCLAVLTMLLLAYFLGGFEHAYPKPVRSGWVQSIGTAA